MAYENTFYINKVPVTCTGTGSHGWISADFMIIANINETSTAYDVNIYTRIDSSGRMNWTGDAILRVNCNGVSANQKVTLAMYSAGTTIWDGPASFSFGAPGTVALKMNLDLDLTVTTGTNGNPGPTHLSDEGNLQHFYYNNYTITIGQDGGLPPLIVPPVVSYITNTNPYNSNTGISASHNSIGIKWTESGTVTNRYYKVDNGSWVSVSSANATITGLTEGTNYTIYTKSSNSSGDSNIISTTIRTKFVAPVVSLSYVSNELDSLIFKWQSNKALASSQYKIGNGNWIDSGPGVSGTIVLSKLNPKTTYTVYFKGTSISTYDSLNSNEGSASGTTLDIAHITSIGDCIFGNSIPITISNPTGNATKLKIWTTGNSNKPEFEMNVFNGTNTFTPTQDQLDRMYKCFTNTNNIPIYFSLSTIGSWSTWTDTQQNKTLQLTGIAKTAHIGINNSPRRAQVWVGVNGVPKRAVVWIGVDNKPKRCI